ncbi:Exosome complex component RRP42 [Lachnellula arida]|uniref:Ribosomal RNA-processing protein 42 n=1 Tax=Lachnellula arida TaxID=1316785 RepID=A0A8T9BBZ1_9HELO|nr:Exosome complex component RRP42 [Lachnellula arida]
MAPSASTQQILLSPAELSYLHTSLSLTPPIRPDGRRATDFRPLHAETDILPGTYGSARICFADGTEAVVGVKAEVEKSTPSYVGDDEGGGEKGRNEWVEVSVEIPGMRDDDSMPVFLAAMLSESLLADGGFTGRLWINRRFHWKLYLDILLLSQPLSYPLPLLSLTTHLALLSTRLPKLKSEKDEDPLFDDDWDASVHLYPVGSAKPAVTLLVMAVKDNIIFDPSKEELSVAEVVLAVSIASHSSSAGSGRMQVDSGSGRQLRLLAVRTIDPPSRLTHPGVPNSLNTATGGTAAASLEQENSKREGLHEEGVWQPPRGGAKRKLIAGMIARVLEKGGVGEDVLDGLDAVELG